VAAKTARSLRSWNEEQLDFPFLSGADSATGTVAESQSTASLQLARSAGRARGLASAIANARAALLGTPIEEVSAQLLPLLEFCEATLTRALDTVALRGVVGKLFSTEEYRSLRGIGQGQWLLAERYGDQESEAAEQRSRQRKKRKKKSDSFARE
jgi:hypothetical protein